MKFYVILAAAVTLTLASGVAAAYMALNIPLGASEEVKSVLSNAALMFTFGMGNIIGLLAGHQWVG